MILTEAGKAREVTYISETQHEKAQCETSNAVSTDSLVSLHCFVT